MIYPDTLQVQSRVAQRPLDGRLADVFSEVETAVTCILEPLDKDMAISFMGIASEQLLLRAFLPDDAPSVRVGDRLRVTSGSFIGKTFNVHAVKDFKVSPLPHVEVGCEEVTGV